MQHLRPIAIVAAFCLSAACHNPVEQTNARDNSGAMLALSWSVGSSSGRTIMPASFPTPTSYDITLTPSPSGSSVSQTGLAVTSFTFNGLSASVYNIAVSGKAGASIVATGAGSVDLTSNASASASITLNYSNTVGTGQIHLTLDLSAAGAGSTTATLTMVDPLGVTTSPNLNPTEPNYTYSITNANSGVYQLFIKVTSSTLNKTATKSEVLNVYQGIDTAATLSFSAGDFNATYVAVTGINPLPAALNISIGGSSGSVATTVIPANASNTLITYSSDAPNIASVDQTGVVTAVATGSAIITASSVEMPLASGSCAVSVPATPAFSITYDANGATGGSAPLDSNLYSSGASATIAGPGSLTRPGYIFGGWNTASDGSGTNYLGGSSFTMSANRSLFAQWCGISSLSMSSGSLAASFTPATLLYNFGTTPPGSFTLTVIAGSACQSTSYIWNDTSSNWATISGTTMTSQQLIPLGDGTDTLELVVTTPDGASRQTIVVTASTLITGASPSVVGANLVSTVNSALNGKYYLAADASISNQVLASGSNNFTGVLNGAGHTIGLTLSGVSYAGLFGKIGSTGIVKNLHVDCSITGGDFLGAIAGINKGKILRCSSSGSIISSSNAVGGLVGQNAYGSEAGTIQYCSSSVNATAYGEVGGLVGDHGEFAASAGGNYSTISDSFARGNVTASSGCAGGLVGYQRQFGTITNCYATGHVTPGDTYGGGIVGAQDPAGAIVTSTYYDISSTGQNDSGKGTGLTTAGMKQQSSYTGWNFTSLWKIDLAGTVNAGYPYLGN